MDRWIKHYSELYGTESTACSDTISNVPSESCRLDLDVPPDIDEITATVQNLCHGKAAGSDGIPAELPKSGLGPLANHLHHLFLKCWNSGKIPQELKDSKITTL